MQGTGLEMAPRIFGADFVDVGNAQGCLVGFVCLGMDQKGKKILRLLIHLQEIQDKPSKKCFGP